jgi:isoquinoline 1-oxidoreductase beta subunit
MERRNFIKLGLTAAGGMAIAVHLPSAEAAKGSFEPNAWIRIEPDDSIHFTCHRTEMGQDVHTSLAVLVGEELEVPVSRFTIRQAPPAAVYTNALLGGQLTGGSTSIRDAWVPLRTAGATARTLLLQAAAQRWKTEVSALRAENGKVIGPGGKSLSYGALAAAAAALPAPDPASIRLKDPSQFTQIGSATQGRLDSPAKVKGERLFGIDMTLPGMAYAALAQCPVIGGTVKSVDDKAARAMKGVREVVNIGEGVAVVADHFWTARKARDALVIDWDFGPGAAVSDASVAAALREGSKKAGAVVKTNGDVAAGLTQSARTLEAEYELPVLAHVALEPMNCLAKVENGACELWVSTQFPPVAQAVAAQRAGLAPEAVTVNVAFIGGGFGRRIEVDFIGQAAAIAKAVPGTPVKLIWTREDDTTHDFYRPASLHRVRGGLGKDGELLALEHQMVSQSITERAFPAFVQNGLDPFMTEGAVNLTYTVPNLHSTVVIQDCGLRVGYWRSVSNPLNAFAFESFIDELAAAAGKDPVDFRLALLAAQPRQQAVLKRAASMAGWGGEARADSALGVASMECYGTHVAMAARVTRAGDGVRLEHIWVAVDPGIAIRPNQIEAQIQSAVITGLMGSLKNRISLKDGRVQQQNFDSFEPLRQAQTPPIDVVVMPSGDAPGGMGEVGTPLVGPMLANAVARLGLPRVRKLPFSEAGVRFV